MLQTLYIVIIIIIYIYYIISTCICIVRCQLYIYIDMLRPWWSVCHPSTDKWGFRRSICNVPWQNSELLGRRNGWQPRTLVYIYIYIFIFIYYAQFVSVSAPACGPIDRSLYSGRFVVKPKKNGSTCFVSFGSKCLLHGVHGAWSSPVFPLTFRDPGLVLDLYAILGSLIEGWFDIISEIGECIIVLNVCSWNNWDLSSQRWLYKVVPPSYVCWSWTIVTKEIIYHKPKREIGVRNQL